MPITALLLHHPELQPEPSEAFSVLVAEFAETAAVTPRQLECLMHVWWFNSFAAGKRLRDGTAGSSGGIVYWLPSLMSHACHPVAFVKMRDGEPMRVVALRAIEVGEEITISYLSGEELKLSAKERRSLLDKSKNFQCSCDRCRVEGVKGSKRRMRRLRREQIKCLAQEFQVASKQT